MSRMSQILENQHFRMLQRLFKSYIKSKQFQYKFSSKYILSQQVLQISVHINQSFSKSHIQSYIITIIIWILIPMLKTTNVFLYIPNIIGYIRYLFIVLCIFTYRQCPLTTIVLASLSQILDAIDGMAARKFNQSTNFGAVLDMVCDRASDAVILAFLGALYPQYAVIFYGDILLDLTSHWYQMYSALSSGEHHKKSPSRFTLLNIYYNNKTVLFTLCAGNGLFMGICYVIYFEQQLGFSPLGIQINRVLLVITGVLFAIKKFMSVIQLISASQKVVAHQAAQKQKQK